MSEAFPRSQAAAEATANHHGTFVWHELMTDDVEGAKAFYGQLFGWRFEAAEMGAATYHVIQAGEHTVGGLSARTDSSAPLGWVGSVSVADVDAAVALASEAGGRLIVPPVDAGGFGRYAIVMDPQGGVVSLCRSASDGPAEPRMPAQGTFSWDQLNTGDVEAAGAFYSKVIGWNLISPDMPGFSVFMRDGAQAASCVQAPSGVSAHWVSHVFVGPLKPSVQKAVALGATVCVEEIEVPGMGAFSVIADPAGALICLFGQP